MKLSVVIALYNNKQYIAKAIMSVINSKLKLYEYEIIVINDGSTDGSELVVEELVDCYPNIILINKENGGQSSARNIGFQMARGKYILCLDSDDYINSELLKSELDYLLANEFDMYAYSFIRRTNNKESPQHASPILKSAVTGQDFICNFVVHGAMCMYFYKTEIIQRNNLRLIEGVFLEDEEFVLKYMLYCNSIMCRQTPLYNYIQHEESSTNNKSMSHTYRLMNDLLIIIDAVSKLENLKGITKIQKTGVIKKKEQLITALFLSFFKNKISIRTSKQLINNLKLNKQYPYVVRYNSIKFRLCAVIFNRPILLKTILYLSNQWN